MKISLIINNNTCFSSRKTFKKMFKKCSYSGEPFTDNRKKTIEHIIPSIREGKNDYANYLVVDAQWNSLRSAMPLGEFIQKYPFVKKNIIDNVNQLEGKEIEGIIWSDEVKKTLKKEIGIDIFS